MYWIFLFPFNLMWCVFRIVDRWNWFFTLVQDFNPFFNCTRIVRWCYLYDFQLTKKHIIDLLLHWTSQLGCCEFGYKQLRKLQIPAKICKKLQHNLYTTTHSTVLTDPKRDNLEKSGEINPFCLTKPRTRTPLRLVWYWFFLSRMLLAQQQQHT